MTIDNDIETWKDVVGYNGLYKVSDLGRVKSYKTYHKRGEQMLKPCKSRIYHDVSLYKDKKQYVICIHRLVALAFVSNPNNYLEINHIDGIKENNSASNLEYCSHSHNQREAIRLGLMKPPKYCKLNEGDAVEVYFLALFGILTQASIGALYNVSQAAVASILSGINWKINKLLSYAN